LNTAETHRLLPDVVEGVRAGIDDLALNLVRPTAVVSQAGSASINITLGHADGLAIV